MNKQTLAFLFILALGFLLRIYGLTFHPVGLTPDEASFGYDAYSILLTGRDQWGNYLPIALKSFGDYKLPLYSYLSIPSVLIFGLNEFSVRLPAAVLGTLAIVSAYLLTRKVFTKGIALATAFLLAISPWHISLSRGAFEANLTTFFLPLGIFLFLEGKKKVWLMSMAAFVFGLNMFTYHSARIITPILILVLILVNKSFFSKNYRKYLLSGVLFSVFLLISAYSFLSGGGSRAHTSTLFSAADIVYQDRVNSIISGEPELIAKVFNNKPTYIVEHFSKNYLSYFSPKFLFTDGPAEGTYGMIPGVGVLYIFELASILAAIFFILKRKINMPFWLVAWVLLSPIPAAISVGPGLAANRAAVMVPGITIFSAIGVTVIYKLFLKFFDKRLVILGAILIISTSTLFFLEDYFYQGPAKEAKAMIYGTREVMGIIAPIANLYSQIIFTKSISEPHIYVAFYDHVDPVFYQKESVSWDFSARGHDWVDQLPVYSLGKYTFRDINWPADLELVDALIVSPAGSVPDKANVIGRVNYPNGTPAYVLVDTRD